MSATEILKFAHNALTLLFGVFVSASFLGIKMNRKNFFALLGFTCASGVVYISVFLLFGEQITTRIYPLIVHLPLILFLMLYFGYRFLVSALSVATAYLCCQVSKWVGLVALDIFHAEWVYYSARIAITILVFVLLLRYVSYATAQLTQKPDKELLIFSLMPFTYYVFDYVTGVYTSLLYSGKEVVAEFLGFALCIAYLLFLLVYFKQYEEKREAEQRNRLIEMQRAQIEKEIAANERSEYKLSLLRHDMRHFLANIAGLIEDGEYEKARVYCGEVISHVDKTAVQKYCTNKTINTILSAYEAAIQENKIAFSYEIHVPGVLRIGDVDLTSILSNAMENAIHAVLQLPPNERKIHLDLRMNGEKLLISLKNTFAEKPKTADGRLLGKGPGHGLGTQSIRSVTEKLKGNCQFVITDTFFLLRIVL